MESQARGESSCDGYRFFSLRQIMQLRNCPTWLQPKGTYPTCTLAVGDESRPCSFSVVLGRKLLNRAGGDLVRLFSPSSGYRQHVQLRGCQDTLLP